MAIGTATNSTVKYKAILGCLSEHFGSKISSDGIVSSADKNLAIANRSHVSCINTNHA